MTNGPGVESPFWPREQSELLESLRSKYPSKAAVAAPQDISDDELTLEEEELSQDQELVSAEDLESEEDEWVSDDTQQPDQDEAEAADALPETVAPVEAAVDEAGQVPSKYAKFFDKHPRLEIPATIAAGVLAVASIIGSVVGVIKVAGAHNVKTCKAIEAETLKDLRSIGPMENLTADERKALVEGVEEFCYSIGASRCLRPVIQYNPQTNSYSLQPTVAKTPSIESLAAVVQANVDSPKHLWNMSTTDERYVNALRELENRVEFVAKAEAPHR